MKIKEKAMEMLENSLVLQKELVILHNDNYWICEVMALRPVVISKFKDGFVVFTPDDIIGWDYTCNNVTLIRVEQLTITS
jgi:hypothetical protein